MSIAFNGLEYTGTWHQIEASGTSVQNSTPTISTAVPVLSACESNLFTGSLECTPIATATLDSWARGEWCKASYGSGTREAYEIADPPESKYTRGYRIVNHTSGNADLAQNGVPLVVGQRYRISMWVRGTDGSENMQIRIWERPTITTGKQAHRFTKVIGTSWELYTTDFKFTGTGTESTCFLIGISSGSGFEMCGMQLIPLDSPRLVVTTSDTTIRSQTVLPNVFNLRAISDGTCDTLRIEPNGQIVIERKIGVYRFNNTALTTYSVLSNGNIRISQYFDTDSDIALPSSDTRRSWSNRFVDGGPSVYNSGAVGQFYITSRIAYLIFDTDITSAEDAKDFFANNETVMYYPLATPVEERLSRIKMPTIESTDTVSIQSALSVVSVNATSGAMKLYKGSQSIDKLYKGATRYV